MSARAKRRARSQGAARAAVRWRDGVHLSDTAIWCDAKRARDVCFVSVASSQLRARHGQLIASAPTFALLERKGQEPASKLAVPNGQPFSLGTQRLELFASGHSVGSASLLVNTEGQRIVYAGPINPWGSALGGAIDHRAADVLVLHAPYGERHYAFGDPAARRAQLQERCRAITEAGGVAVVLVTSTVKALDLAATLAEVGAPVQLHRRVSEAAKRIAPLCALPEHKRWDPKSRLPRVLLWPTRARASLDHEALPKGSALLLVSGGACDAARLAELGADEGITLSNQADHAGLLSYIESSGASQVYLVQSPDRGHDLAAAASGLKIEAIGPPEQLQLF